jgi:hypothetical protein
MHDVRVVKQTLKRNVSANANKAQHAWVLAELTANNSEKLIFKPFNLHHDNI